MYQISYSKDFHQLVVFCTTEGGSVLDASFSAIKVSMLKSLTGHILVLILVCR